MKITRLAPVLAALALLLLLVSGPGVRMHLWTFVTGFTLLKWAAYTGLAATLASLIFLLVPATRNGRAGMLVGALLVGIGVAWVPWQGLQKARSVPPIHDISTDTTNPPAFQAALALRHADHATNSPEYGGPAIASQQHAAYPDIQPLDLALPPDTAFAHALAAARGMGWTINASAPDSGRIEATATTFWFGFHDDIVIRVRAQGAGSRVDVRSVSRVGISDVGTNAARIRKYLARLRAEG